MKLTFSILFWSLTLLPITALSQFEDNSEDQQKPTFQKPNAYLKSIDIHVMPFIFYNPRIRVGTEFKSSNKLAFCVDVGYADGFVKGEGYKFLEIRPEIKYYFHSPTPKLSWYAAVELFYITMTETRYHSEYTLPDSAHETFFDQAQMSMVNRGFHVKVGLKWVTRSQFSFEYYAGTGLGFRKID